MTNNPVDEWFNALPATQRPILDRMRSFIRECVPDATEELKWNRPCYSTVNGLFCYLHTTKNHATLGFQNGSSLSDPKKLLEGDGKHMRHIKLRSKRDIEDVDLRAMLIEAISI